MSTDDNNGDNLGRSENNSDRPDFNIDFTLDDPAALQSSVNRVKKEELANRKLQREEDQEDRREWVLRWQQNLILLFLLFVLLTAMVASSWAMHIELWGGTEEQTKRAHHIFEILMDAGIAALVGFFAIKRFEK